MTSNLLAAIPPLANVSCPCLAVDAEFPLTESPVIVALEEVILFVLPEESSAQVSSGKPFPLSLDALGVLAVDMGLLSRLEPPIVVTLEEVHLVVESGKNSCVQVAGNARETFRDLFRVAWLHVFVDELPVLVALENISGSSVLPSDRSVNVSWQTPPVCRDPSWRDIPDNRFVVQLPILLSPEHISSLVFSQEDGIH